MDKRMGPRTNRINESPIARRRVELGLTQKQLADMLGCTVNAVSFWERGKHKPAGYTLHALARALECTIEELIPE